MQKATDDFVLPLPWADGFDKRWINPDVDGKFILFEYIPG